MPKLGARAARPHISQRGKEMKSLTARLSVLAATLLAAGTAPFAFADDATFKQHMQAGVAALKISNFVDAVNSFSEAQKVAEADHNEFYLAMSISRIGDVRLQEKKYSEAEVLFKQALPLAEKAKASGRSVLLIDLTSLAAIYLAQSDYPQAETYLKRVIAMLESNSSDMNVNPKFLPTALDNLAVVYRSTKKFDQAETLYKRAIPLWEKLAGPEDSDTATSINNLAALYYYERKYAEAEPLFVRSLAIREKTLGANHPEVINNANNLILVYRALKKTSEAEAISKKFATNGGEDSNAPAVLTGAGVDTDEWSKHIQAGRDHLNAQRYTEAEKELQAAVSEAEKGGVEDRRLAATLYNLGHVYAKQKNYEKAETTYKRSLTICEKICGDKDKEVLRTMTSLAKLYTEEKKYDQAEPLFKHVVDVQQKALGRNHQDVAEALNNLAAMYSQAGRKSESSSYEKRAKSVGAKKGKIQ